MSVIDPSILRASSQRVPAAKSLGDIQAAAGLSSRRDRPPQRHVAADTTSPEAPPSSHTRSGADEGLSGGAAAPSSTCRRDEQRQSLLQPDGHESPVDAAAPPPSDRGRGAFFWRWRLPTSISEADLLRGYENAAPWTSEAR